MKDENAKDKKHEQVGEEKAHDNHNGHAHNHAEVHNDQPKAHDEHYGSQTESQPDWQSQPEAQPVQQADNAATANPFGNVPGDTTGTAPQTAPTPVQPVVAPAPAVGVPQPQPQQMMGTYANNGQPMAMPNNQAVTPCAAPSLQGLRGWLLFAMIVMALFGIGSLLAAVVALADLISGDGAVSTVLQAVLMPVVGVVMLVAAVNIGLRKRVGKTAAIVAIVTTAIVMTISGVVSTVTTVQDMSSSKTRRSSYSGYPTYYETTDYRYDRYVSKYDKDDMAAAIVEGIGTVVVQLVVYGLYGLYFQKSRRVKETLVE